MTDEIVEMIEEVEIIDHHTIVTIDGTIEVEEMIVGMIEIGETLGTFINKYRIYPPNYVVMSARTELVDLFL